MYQKTPIIVDGPNFINRVLEFGIDKDIIAQNLSLVGLRNIINTKLNKLNIEEMCDNMEFVCSAKNFGPENNKFTVDEMRLMLNNLMEERGVHVEKVNIPGKKEKGVDTTIAAIMMSYLPNYSSIVLVSEDKDYIPILRKWRELGKRLFVVSLRRNYPIELTNEAYVKIEIKDDFDYLFKYGEKIFDLKSLTKEQCREMIASANDHIENSIVMSKYNKIFVTNSVIEEDDFLHFELNGKGGISLGYKLRNSNLSWLENRISAYTDRIQHGSNLFGPLAASNTKYVSEFYELINETFTENVNGEIKDIDLKLKMIKRQSEADSQRHI